MNNIYSDKKDDFEFEKHICFSKPELWLNEAHNLFYSAKVLYEFQCIKKKELFDKEKKLGILFTKEITKRDYFNWRNQRMLWAYGFENIFKGIIIINTRNDAPESNQVPIDKIKSHNLTHLGKEAGVISNSCDTFYLGVLEKCSLWAGRYPLPVKASQMYTKRAPMESRQALIERNKRQWEAYTSGKIKRMECESDVLHSGIGTIEYEYYCNLKSISIRKFNDLMKINRQLNIPGNFDTHMRTKRFM